MGVSLDGAPDDGKRAKRHRFDLGHVGVVARVVILNDPNPAVPVRVMQGRDDKVDKVDKDADEEGLVPHAAWHDGVLCAEPLPSAKDGQETASDDDHGDHRWVLPAVLSAIHKGRRTEQEGKGRAEEDQPDSVDD